MKINVVSMSACLDAEDLTSKKGKYNILKSKELDKVSILVKYNNRVFLPEAYNETVKRFGNEDCIIVLVHDDVVITDTTWTDKIVKALEKYDVVGLAGGSNPVITEPCLWHIMCPRETHSGTVAHVNFADNSTFKTHFGKNGRVLILDGLFLAFNPKKLLDAGVKFDESNPCVSHFYDIDFSLTCNKHKLKLGTTNIEVTHSSPGLREYTKEWLNGQKWFLSKVDRGEY